MRWSTWSTLGSTRGCGMPEAPLLEVENLTVTFRTEAGPVRAVDRVSFTIGGAGDRQHRRRVRLGQDRDGDERSGPPGRGQRRGRGLDPLSRPRAGGPAAARPAGAPWRCDRHDLPGSDDGTHAGLHDRLADRGAAAGASAALGSGRQGSRGRAGARGGHRRPQGRGRPLPAPALGRHAAAGGDRHGPVLQPGAPAGRRAHDGPGRHRPGADPRAAAAAARRSSAPRSS